MKKYIKPPNPDKIAIMKVPSLAIVIVIIKKMI